MFHRKTIIGLAYVKKIGFKNKKKEKNKLPTLGGPFLLKNYRLLGLSIIMTKLYAYQIKLAEKKYLYCKIVTQNKVTVKNALKCGFKNDRRKVQKKNKKKLL